MAGFAPASFNDSSSPFTHANPARGINKDYHISSYGRSGFPPQHPQVAPSSFVSAVHPRRQTAAHQAWQAAAHGLPLELEPSPDLPALFAGQPLPRRPRDLDHHERPILIAPIPSRHALVGR